MFLLQRLVPPLSEHPDAESYSRQLGDSRADLAGWLAKLVGAPDRRSRIEGRPRASRSSARRRRSRGGRSGARSDVLYLRPPLLRVVQQHDAGRRQWRCPYAIDVLPSVQSSARRLPRR